MSKTGQADIEATNVQVVSSSKITCDFDLYGAAPGNWDVVVTNTDSQQAILAEGFRVEPAIWYLAEGCTQGGMETWVLVQNPGDTQVTVDLTFMTSAGEQAGPQDFPIPARSRHSFNLGSYVTDWDVSTKVTASDKVICERAMYGNGRTWAHDSIGYSH